VDAEKKALRAKEIRINEIARELGVKASQIVCALPALGLNDKKTHSSAISMIMADRLRQYFGPGMTDRELVDVTFDFERLLNEIAHYRSDALFDLTPRQFEELIAEIWDRFGYQVELTARTRDHGRDIVAIKKSEVETKYLIECKRYRSTHKVGVSIVRALFGVKVHEMATKAILATTSTFTRDSREFLDNHKWELEGRDHDGIVRWASAATKLKRSPGGVLWVPDYDDSTDR